ncbi:MAG: type IV pilus modification PilV family protein [Noviherbaspirillum sp.]
MRNGRLLPSTASEQGIVLLEALIAILIFSIGVLGIVGLQASMIKANTESKYRTEAGIIVQQQLGAMWVDQGNLVSYVVGEPGRDISATSGLPNGRLVILRGDPSCGGDLSCFLVKVSWQQSGEDVRNVTNVARITEGEPS